ncbi:helicase-like transcription factor isoform X2 [Montipora capricornis]|uniref:helicase-like transcription factor isoform X2 n=1 Tax=Montipora capricornis TaxID=246305 RepID=UPI0035F1B5DC
MLHVGMAEAKCNSSGSTVNVLKGTQNSCNICGNGIASCKCSSSSEGNTHFEVARQEADGNLGLQASKNLENCVKMQPLSLVLQKDSAAEIAGSPRLSSDAQTTKDWTTSEPPTDIVLPQVNMELRFPTSTSDMRLVAQTNSCVQENTKTLDSRAKIAVPFAKHDNKKDDLISCSSSATILPTQATSSDSVKPLTPQFVSAAIDMALHSVSPAANPSLACKMEEPQLSVASSLVSTSTSLEVQTATNLQVPEGKALVSIDQTVAVSTTERLSTSCSKDSVSVINADSSNFVPELLTAFPNFTPCLKCNSLLVCSCSGPSSSDNSSVGNVTCCNASCQGVCVCYEHSNMSSPDVKPQVFPVVPLNRLDQLFDSLGEYDKVAKAEQPEAITTRLFPHQLQALNWMVTRENNTDLAPFWTQVNKNTWINKGTNFSTDRKPDSSKGGILADDMGLGKTLTVITLIMANHLKGKPMFCRTSSNHKRAASTSSANTKCKAEPANKLPRSDTCDDDNVDDAMFDNKDDVKKVTIKKRKVALGINKKRFDNKSLKQPGFRFRQMYLSKFSSKSVKKEVKEDKPKTPVKPMNIDGDDCNVSVGPWLSVGKKADATKGSCNSKSLDAVHAATLIVCPLSVLSNWTDQICSHVHRDVNLQVYMYYGPERLRDVKFLKEQDIVLTTYPTLTNDYSRNDSPLHKIKWLRVILDEGHTIRNPQTRLTKAMLDLAAERRWVLTGTPIQNRLDDLWSVVRFLRLEPFDDKQWWNSAISSSVRRGCPQAVNRLQKLLKHISIRRLKSDQDEGKPLVKLPPRTVVIQEVELSGEERALYDAMQNHGQLVIGRYLQNGMVLKKYAHCFAILMRLRQLCLHPSLCAEQSEYLQNAQNILQGIDDSDDEDLDTDHDSQRLINDLLVTLSSGVDEECSVCLDSLVDPVITRCAHVFCQQCIMDVISSENVAPNCPLCRAPVNENELTKVPVNKKKETTGPEKPPGEPVGEFKKSSKLESLLNALVAIRNQNSSTKSLVVSQFTSFLDIIEEALRQENFFFVRLDGRMTQEARAQAIERFTDPSSSSPTVFLLSLTAGGVGLNLTAATRVFLLDPAWNPAVEEQCFDRSHRLGQTQEVIITKYIVANSVEERMLTLQDQKRDLISQAFGLETQSQEDRRRARVRDIKHLIGL